MSIVKTLSRSLAACALVALGSCNSGAPDTPSVGQTSQAQIVDALHNGGAAGFLFLPPMVPAPAHVGGFVAPSDATVRIDQITTAGVTVRTLATFTSTSGPQGQVISTHLLGQPSPNDGDHDTDPESYQYARWITADAQLSTSAIYRVNVFVPAVGGGQRLLGFSDVQVALNSHTFLAVDTSQYTPLLANGVLRIKFRIDIPTCDQDNDGFFDWLDNCPTVSNHDQLDSLHCGIGDACRCQTVTCAAPLPCFGAGVCQPTTGQCTYAPQANGTSCSLPNATASCDYGLCLRTACAPGWADCPANNGLLGLIESTPLFGCTTQVNTVTNCGACGTVCPSAAHASPACSATGTCGLTCATGYANCDGNNANGCELPDSTDPANCGGCGVHCTADQLCNAGTCTALTCAAGTGDCDHLSSDGCEANLTNNVADCGACGNVCSFPNAAASCASSACLLGACTAGYANCNGLASDGCESTSSTDTANCGACGHVCALPNASPVCVASACAVGSCASNYANCDGVASNGCEVNLQANPTNCGACGTTCAFAHASASCAAGACAIGTCAAGYGNCDGIAGNGCETVLATDEANCGACGTVCASGPNSTATCGAGACALTCAAGYGNCDGNAANGCEVNTTTSNANCGACGVTCGADQTCGAGACTSIVCSAGSADCDHLASTGCEVNTLTSVSNCGGCGITCTFANAAPQCTSGTCGFGVCNMGYADCDGAQANGCEINLSNDTSHCGGCGTVCSFPNAEATCSAGACGLGACTSGHANCDGNAANGCESTSASDVNNCGACGHVCPAGPNATATCSAGTCGIVCPSGSANCSGVATDGCTVNTTSDTHNCGRCGNPCGADQLCVAGTCTALTCAAGTADCNQLASDGCEINTQVSDSNCGSCGHLCAFPNAAEQCVAGVCGIAACAAGYADCDGILANGCETNLNTNPNHCGACATACNVANGTAACGGGACTVGSCATGFANCNGLAGDGCEVNTTTDTHNCTSCGVVCAVPPLASATCSTGGCGYACAAGFANCDGVPGDGCEINLGTDVHNCGACAVTCTVDQICSSGACTALACAPTLADCDHVASDGCEVTLNTNVSNCGTCGNACSPPNGTGACSVGVCMLAACNAGFADCDSSLADGCEINLAADVSNCGACGNLCTIANGTAACNTGVCAVAACNAGFADCDGNPANGCEVNLATSSANCGACGNACAGGATCTSGSCAAACIGAVYEDNFNYQDWYGYDYYQYTGDGSACTTTYLEILNNQYGDLSYGETNPSPIAVNVGQTYCLAGWIRANPGSEPYLGIVQSYGYSPQGDGVYPNWLIGPSGAVSNLITVAGVSVTPVTATEDSNWYWYAQSFTMPYDNAYLEATVDPNNYYYAAADFGDVQLFQGACPPAPATVCTGSLSCPFECPAGQALCDGYSDGGCQTAIANDPNNCGGCGIVCAAGLPCTAGSCGCPSGTTLCGGACTSRATDSANCGGCGIVCAGNLSCIAGSCGCPSGTTQCGNFCSTLTADPANCGACGHVCPTPTSGRATCISGTCGTAVTVTYTVGAGPRGVAVDASGNAWTTNSASGTVSKLSASGSLLFTVPGFNSPFGIAIASDGSAWVSNFGAGTVTHVSASGSVLATVSSNGAQPAQVAIDSAGNVWVGNYGSGSITKLSSTGALIGTFNGVGHPQYITFDPSGNAWVGTQYTNAVVEFSPSGTLLRTVNVGTEDPDSIGFDQAGNLWVTIFGEAGGSTVVELNPTTGAIIGTYPSGGTAPYTMEFDVHGNAWLCNYGSNNVVELCGTAACGTIGHILATYSVGANPDDLTIDAAGNVWTANASGSSVTVLAGVAR